MLKVSARHRGMQIHHVCLHGRLLFLSSKTILWQFYVDFFPKGERCILCVHFQMVALTDASVHCLKYVCTGFKMYAAFLCILKTCVCYQTLFLFHRTHCKPGDVYISNTSWVYLCVQSRSCRNVCMHLKILTANFLHIPCEDETETESAVSASHSISHMLLPAHLSLNASRA